VIDEAQKLDLISLGGQLQFLLNTDPLAMSDSGRCG
jgi:hypothetical protein